MPINKNSSYVQIFYAGIQQILNNVEQNVLSEILRIETTILAKSRGLRQMVDNR